MNHGALATQLAGLSPVRVIISLSRLFRFLPLDTVSSLNLVYVLNSGTKRMAG